MSGEVCLLLFNAETAQQNKFEWYWKCKSLHSEYTYNTFYLGYSNFTTAGEGLC